MPYGYDEQNPRQRDCLLRPRPGDVPAESRSAEPTLARLSFWVPPGGMVEFEAAFQEKVGPLLDRAGFIPSAERGGGRAIDADQERA